MAVRRLPDDRPGLIAHARRALEACYDSNNHQKAARTIEAFLAEVNKKEAKGKLDSVTADTLRSYGENLLFAFLLSEVCPAT